jgi:hypothetical protein
MRCRLPQRCGRLSKILIGISRIPKGGERDRPARQARSYAVTGIRRKLGLEGHAAYCLRFNDATHGSRFYSCFEKYDFSLCLNKGMVGLITPQQQVRKTIHRVRT